MLKRSSKLLIILTCLLLTSVPVWAETLELSLAEAFALSLANNLSFRLQRIDWQAARADLERAEIVGDSEMLKEASEAWEKANQLYLDEKASLYSSVRNSYYQLLEKETSVANVLKAKERAENQLAVDKKKFEAGLLSTLDIQRSENSLFEAEYRYEKELIGLETERMKFNELLGLPLDTQIVLTERMLLEFVPFELDLAACVELAFSVDGGIAAAKEILAKAKEAVSAASSPFSPRVELERALAEEEKAEIALRQAEQNLYFKIRSSFYSLLDQAHNLEALEQQIELERKTLQAEEAKYAAGVLSNAQIVSQQEKLADLERSYSSSLLSYTLARLDLLRTIGLAEEPWEAAADD